MAPAVATQNKAAENVGAKLEMLESRLAKLEEDSRCNGIQQSNFPIAHDDRYHTLVEHALDPKVGFPDTVGATLINQIQLPESVYTSVWITPLIDSRLFFGEPEKKFVDLPLSLQEKYATKELTEGSTSTNSDAGTTN